MPHRQDVFLFLAADVLFPFSLPPPRHVGLSLSRGISFERGEDAAANIYTTHDPTRLYPSTRAHRATLRRVRWRAVICSVPLLRAGQTQSRDSFRYLGGAVYPVQVLRGPVEAAPSYRAGFGRHYGVFLGYRSGAGFERKSFRTSGGLSLLLRGQLDAQYLFSALRRQCSKSDPARGTVHSTRRRAEASDASSFVVISASGVF